LIYFLTSGPGSLLAEVQLLAESAAAVLPGQRFVWLVSGSWSPRLASALQSVRGASVEPWRPQRPMGAGEAATPEAEIPQAMIEVASRPDCTWALYCAPGVFWISPPTEILDDSSVGDIVLLPALLQPHAGREAPAGELEALMRGVFTHRFVAVRAGAEGREFLGWWRKRLLEIPIQDRSPESWLNLAPALFSSARILRSPRYNVHRGNLHERPLDDGFPRVTVHGMPIAFFDLGAPGDPPPAESDLDPKTRRAFRSVESWYQHRLSTLARPFKEEGAQDLVLSR
jgi:hypothetical protein